LGPDDLSQAEGYSQLLYLQKPRQLQVTDVQPSVAALLPSLVQAIHACWA